MKKILLASFLPFVIALACAGQTQQPAGSQPDKPANADSDTSHPKRVRADLSGFELAPKQPSTDSSVQIGGGTRGGLPGPVLYAPHRAKSYSANPTFYWSQPGVINEFTLRIYDSSDNTVFEKTVHGKSYTYPPGAPALKPGATYSWTVQLAGGLMAEPAEPVEFVVQSLAEREPVKSALAEILGHSLQDQLRRAQIFEDARIWYDAVASYSDVIAKFPDQPEAYKRRGEIYDQIPETRDLAEADFANAEKLRGSGTPKK
jgi:Domain of Unknown Function (DUF928)